MKKIIKYGLVRADIGSGFVDAMQSKIDSGWQPFGPISRDPHNPSYVVQAVVQYAPDSVDEIAYVVAENVVDLSEKVSNRVREGWVPHASVAMAIRDDRVCFCQPMTKLSGGPDPSAQ